MSLYIKVGLGGSEGMRITLGYLYNCAGLNPLTGYISIRALILTICRLGRLFRRFANVLVLSRSLNHVGAVIVAVGVCDVMGFPYANISVCHQVRRLFDFLFRLNIVTRLCYQAALYVSHTRRLDFYLDLENQ